MIVRIIIILSAGVFSFIIGRWLGDLIWPDSFLLGPIIGGLLFGGGVLYITRNIGRQRQ